MAINLVFLDANILMELFFSRAKRKPVTDAILALPEGSVLVVSILSLATLMYYVEAKKFNKKTAHKFVKEYKILGMDNSNYEWAEDNDQGDFEDALQVACARRHGCTRFITLDQDVERRYGKFIQVQTIC